MISDELVRIPSRVAREPGLAIERREASTAVEKPVHARDPVGDLAIGEMTQHFNAVPCAVAFAPGQRVFRRGRNQAFDDARRLEQ